jgi:hypothetical protein
MAYFNRKKIVSILAEQPDMISVFPECVLPSQQLDDMAHIPDIALCDVTMMTSPQAFDNLFLSARPDAVVPVAAYSGVERVRWSEYDNTVALLKKHCERTWHVHVLPPVVLGAPLFRSALCLYAGRLADQHMRMALQCAACFFYRIAAFIPLCRQCSVNSLYLGGLAPCCSRVLELEKSGGILKYCRILLSGYGIDLFIPDAAGKTARFVVSDPCESDDPGFECFMHSPGCSDAAPTDMRDEVLRHYFENFAIPFAANVMSRLLAGHDIDFISTARTFWPSARKKTPLSGL